jgi:hypothetical protein
MRFEILPILMLIKRLSPGKARWQHRLVSIEARLSSALIPCAKVSGRGQFVGFQTGLMIINL